MINGTTNFILHSQDSREIVPKLVNYRIWPKVWRHLIMTPISGLSSNCCLKTVSTQLSEMSLFIAALRFLSGSVESLPRRVEASITSKGRPTTPFYNII